MHGITAFRRHSAQAQPNSFWLWIPQRKSPTFLPDRCNQRKKRWLADAAIFQDQAMKVVEF